MPLKADWLFPNRGKKFSSLIRKCHCGNHRQRELYTLEVLKSSWYHNQLCIKTRRERMAESHTSQQSLPWRRQYQTTRDNNIWKEWLDKHRQQYRYPEKVYIRHLALPIPTGCQHSPQSSQSHRSLQICLRSFQSGYW